MRDPTSTSRRYTTGGFLRELGSRLKCSSWPIHSGQLCGDACRGYHGSYMNRAHVVAIVSTALLALPSLVAAGTCPSITHNLSFGTRGQEVEQLQLYLMDAQFLASTAWGGSQANAGYFGRLTKAAVIQFQTHQSLPVTGFVGPLTRAAIARVCNITATIMPTPGNPPSPAPSPSQTATLYATPISGVAPFTVTFTSTPLDPGYGFDPGDTYENSITSGFHLGTPLNVTQTYTVPGIYTARLIQLAASKTVSTVTITVTDANGSTQPTTCLFNGHTYTANQVFQGACPPGPQNQCPVYTCQNGKVVPAHG